MADKAELKTALDGRQAEVVTDRALEIVARLHRELDETRRQLLSKREERQAELTPAAHSTSCPETREVREGDWKVVRGPRRHAEPPRGDHRPRPTARWSSTR